MPDHWSQPAFDGSIVDVDGEKRVYGRGTQDMKLVCIQYLVAISRLIDAGVTPERSVVLSFVPDEEVGGAGMAWFLQSDWYAAELEGKVAIAFDEGLANVNDAFTGCTSLVQSLSPSHRCI